MMTTALRKGRLFLVPLASVATLSLGAARAACEEQSPEAEANPKAARVIMMKTFFRGPCRFALRESFLRPDSSSSDSTSDSRLKKESLVKDMAECFRRYPNVHVVLANQVMREGFIDRYEIALKEKKVVQLPWNGADIDWSPLWEHAKKSNLRLDDFGATPIDWKTFLSGYYGQRDLDDYVNGRNVKCKEYEIILGHSLEEEPISDSKTFAQDPELVPVRVRVNRFDSDGTPLELCYARDQTGSILGYRQFAQNKASADDASGETSEYELTLFIQPGKTMCVKLYKVFKGENVEPRFYTSKAKFLVEAAFEAGLE